jgi:hypothetical protein
MQDIFKPSIWIEDNIPTLMLGTSPGEDSLIPMPGTLPGKGGTAPASEADPRTLASPIGQDQEPRREVATIVGLPSPDVDWQKLISEYLRCGTIPDDETETRCLAHRAKGYLIHNDSCITTAPQASFSSASLLRKVRHYSSIFMRGSVDTMPHHEAWMERLSEKVSTSQWPLAMQRRS